MRIRRPPDRIIGSIDDPYLLRWHLIPRNQWFNIYLHKFMRPDDDRALHSHPWRWNCSVILTRGYVEHMPSGKRRRAVGSLVFRRGEAWHRVELDRGPCWTLFLTGDIVREWGFACPKGFVHWREFTRPNTNGNEVGKGCD